MAEQQGIKVCHRLREFSQVPVIILAAKYDEDDVVISLDASADDFITKPFGMGEFMARFKASIPESSFTTIVFAVKPTLEWGRELAAER